MKTRARFGTIGVLGLIAGLAAVFAEAAPGWSTETVDASDGSGFFSSLAFNPVTGFPAIAYSAGASGNRGQVRLAEWNGGSWNVQPVVTGKSIAQSAVGLAFDPSGNPAISYCGSGLFVARRTGSTWSSQTVDSKGNCGAPLVYAVQRASATAWRIRRY